MNCLIAYVTYSGNTEEIAELIKKELLQQNMAVDLYEIGIVDWFVPIDSYDIIFLVSFTWDYGDLHDEMYSFLERYTRNLSKVAVFGLGDTQFGGERLFCQAVDRLITFYNSKWDGLKIEQSPRGSQEKLVTTWTVSLLVDVKSMN